MRSFVFLAGCSICAAGAAIAQQSTPQTAPRLTLAPGTLDPAVLAQQRIDRLEGVVKVLTEKLSAMQSGGASKADLANLQSATASKSDLIALRDAFDTHTHFQIVATQNSGKQQIDWRATTIPAKYCISTASTIWSEQKKCNAPSH